jgi:hypothetical protein
MLAADSHAVEAGAARPHLIEVSAPEASITQTESVKSSNEDN